MIFKCHSEIRVPSWTNTFRLPWWLNWHGQIVKSVSISLSLSGYYYYYYYSLLFYLRVSSQLTWAMVIAAKTDLTVSLIFL